mgnify:CR=1 FL=1
MHHGYGVIGRQGPAVKQHCLKYTHKTLDLNRINHISTNRKSLYEAGFFCCHGTDETYGATAGSGARVSSFPLREHESQAPCRRASFKSALMLRERESQAPCRRASFKRALSVPHRNPAPPRFPAPVRDTPPDARYRQQPPRGQAVLSVDR